MPNKVFLHKDCRSDGKYQPFTGEQENVITVLNQLIRQKKYLLENVLFFWEGSQCCR